ncbi:sulfotransferase, partial [Streptomyces minutiscleroticus]
GERRDVREGQREDRVLDHGQEQKEATSAYRCPGPEELATDRLLRRPVFVMSPVRSGSTLLRMLLDAHSELHSPHELHIRRLEVGFEPSMLDYGRKDDSQVVKGLGDWRDKIRTGRVQAGRELPEDDEIPDLLRPMCVSWGHAS